MKSSCVTIHMRAVLSCGSLSFWLWIENNPHILICCFYLGDPRRPYPQDIEMRSGWLGRLMEGVAMETDQPVTDSNLQDIMQASTSSSNVLPTSALGKIKCKLVVYCSSKVRNSSVRNIQKLEMTLSFQLACNQALSGGYLCTTWLCHWVVHTHLLAGNLWKLLRPFHVIPAF